MTGKRIFLVREMLAQIDAGFPIQVDIQDNTESFAEIVMPEQCISRSEQSRVQAVHTQQSLHDKRIDGIIVHYKN